MARRSSGRGKGAGGAVIAVLAAPYMLGYYSMNWALLTLCALAGFAWALFERPAAPVVVWFREWRGVTLGVMGFASVLITVGIINGVEDRETEARRESDRQHLEAEDRAREAAREVEAARLRAADQDAARARRDAAARQATVEAQWSPAERAARATTRLESDDDVVDRYCDAARLLSPIAVENRRDEAVRPAFHALHRAEREALRTQRATFEEGRALVCRDGETSPTCECHGSHRGCCSWHGGVRGCEPLPTEVTCPAGTPPKFGGSR